jgi:hypothetical protein
MKQTPDGDLLVRFVAHVVERVKTNILGKPAYSRNTLMNGFYHLVRRLVFEYADFTLTAHHTSRIDSVITSLVKAGKLTRGVWREPQWIGFLALRFLLTSYISEGLTDGVLSWDVRVCRWLSMVLQSSADCRAGEVTLSVGYTGEEFLKWEDIEIKLVGGDTLKHLRARVTLRWEKGSK